jgi:hypothetical protein
MKTHEVFHFKLEVLTPTHIGMGKEKEYTNGLDFIYNERKKEYVVLKPDEIFRKLRSNEVALVSGYLSSGNTQEFANYLEKGNLINDDSTLYTWGSEYAPGRESIKATYRNAMGNWAIPGSSIKGALRGIILKALHNGIGAYNPRILLGEISNDPLRFLQVTDCPMEGLPGIYPVKIFSADLDGNNKVGRWKNERKGGHSAQFRAKGFVSFYEMLTDGIYGSEVAQGNFRVGWGTSEQVGRRKGVEMPNFQRIFSGHTANWLINTIKSHTDQYLQQEIDFFESYPNNSINKETFWDELKWLKEENLRNENSCILRVGANVGYHSITGNWQFDNHITAVENNRRNIGRGGIEKAYKTRKLVFDFNDKNTRRFALPGFVKISLTDTK